MELLKDYWTFVAVAVILAAVGKTLKVLVAGPERVVAARHDSMLLSRSKSGISLDDIPQMNMATYKRIKRLEWSKKLFLRTLKLQQIIAGGLIGLIPLPVPDFVDAGDGGYLSALPVRILYFLVAGAASDLVHAKIWKKLSK